MTELKIILIVCSGNIHRSVIAERCINRALNSRVIGLIHSVSTERIDTLLNYVRLFQERSLS